MASLPWLDAYSASYARLWKRVVGVYAGWGIAAVSVGWMLLVGFEGLLWLPSGARLGLLLAWLLGGLLFAGWATRRLKQEREAGRWSSFAVARTLGSHDPALSDSLVVALELEREHRSAPNPFLERSLDELGRRIQHVAFHQVPTLVRVKAPLFTAAFALTMFIGLAGWGPEAYRTAQLRLLQPAVAFERPAPFALEVLPGDTTLVRGTPLEVRVQTIGAVRPAEVYVRYQMEGEATETAVKMRADTSGHFLAALPPLRDAVEYVIDAGAVRSRAYTAEVVSAPEVAGLQVRVIPPAYTRLPAIDLPPGLGDVQALPGTEVQITVRAPDVTLSEAVVRFDSLPEVPLTRTDNALRGTFRIRQPDRYRVHLVSDRGIPNAGSVAFTLSPLVDEAPQVRLDLQPDTTARPGAPVATAVLATDDFGFSRAKLTYFSSPRGTGQGAERVTTVPVSIAPYPIAQRLNVLIDLNAHVPDLQPGDRVEWQVTVWDNDAVSGPKSATTPRIPLQLVTRFDQLDATESRQDTLQQRLETLEQQRGTSQERLERLRESLQRQRGESSWQEERQLELLQQEQAEREAQAAQLAEQTRELTRQMREEGLLDEATLRQFEQLQRVMQELSAPELQEALQRLQQAMEEMNATEIQRSLEELSFDSRLYQQRLERTLELFQQLRLQAEMEQAAQRAEMLAEEQQQRAQETSEARTQEEFERIAQEQQEAAEQAQRLEEQLRQIAERSQNVRQSPREQLEQLQQEQEQNSPSEQLEQNAEQLRQQQRQPAREQQEQLQQQFQRIRQRLRSAQQQTQGNQQSVNAAAIRQALDNVLRLSRQQERVQNQTRATPSDSPALREFARQQVAMAEGLSVVADTLMAVAARAPDMGRAVQEEASRAQREMRSAVSTLGDRQAPQAASHQRAALTRLNELALILAIVLDQQMNSSQGQGQGESMQQLMQQLQQMSGQQQQLNRQIQQMLNETQGQRLDGNQQQRLQQLAEQQAEIRRQLREIQRTPRPGNPLLGDLERVAEDMQRAIEQMQRGRVDRPLTDRQQEILQRLLQAQSALREQGEEERREGNRPQATPLSPGQALPPERWRERLRQDLLRTSERAYPPEVQQLIRQYFDELSRTLPPP